jgi:hypothetical protein
MAAAGILTCAVALLDVFIPAGSLVGFLAKMALLGLAVTGVVIGYTWLCDKCESYFLGRREPFLDDSESDPNEVVSPKTAVSPRVMETRFVYDARCAPAAPLRASRGWYTRTFHGSVLPKDSAPPMATAARVWHGQ